MPPTDAVHRRLSFLRTTYPGWDITRQVDEDGQERWRAHLHRSITAPMRAAGVVEVVERPDGISLASALASQARIVHAFPAGS